MRRSLLFIPANNPGMMQNAKLFNADSIIFDLEDAISMSEKDSARSILKNYLNTYDFNFEVIVRVNDLDSVYFLKDLNEIVLPSLDTIMLPKARASHFKKLDEILTKLETEKKLKKKIKVIPIVELAISVLEIEEIAKAKRVDGILLGAEDLSSDMEFERTLKGDEIFYPRTRLAYVARAYGIDAIDTPFTNVRDNDGLVKDATYAKSLGLQAKAAIHPNQVRFINEVFSPSKKQIEFALKVELASKNNKGAFSLDGQMIDKPIIERNKKILEKARKFDLL